MIERVELMVATGERPLVMNKERRGDHWARAGAMREWKKSTAEALMEARFKDTYPRIGVLFYPTCKAILDALVLGGVVADDNGPHVEFFSMEAPNVDPNTTYPYMCVHVIPREAVAGHDLGECECRR